MRKGRASGKSGEGKIVRVTMTPERRQKALNSVDWKRIAAMTDEEIEQNALDDPDSIVSISDDAQLVPAMPDVAALRGRMKLSQAQFAARFGFSVATVRNWEQGRVLPDGSARILLAVIAGEPQAVIRALHPPSDGRPTSLASPTARPRGMSDPSARFAPENAGHTTEILSRKVTRNLPVNWGREPLSEFWDAAMNNVVANFAHDQPDIGLLRQVDHLFSRIVQNLIEPQNPMVALLLLRTHSAFRGASLVAMTGMPTEAYPLLRVVLEQAGYALLMHGNPGHDEAWLRRHDGPAEKRIVRRVFTPTEIKDLLGKVDKGLQKVFNELYEYAIDFGAHPNERSLTSNLSLSHAGRTKSYKVQYLHGNTIWVRSAIRNTARAGLFALFAFQHAMAARFQLLGIRDEMNSLRKRL